MHRQPAGQPHATSEDVSGRTSAIVSLMMFLSYLLKDSRSFSIRLKVYLMGVVRGSSLVSRTKTASSFAGSVLLALRLIEWIAPGGSDQLSPAR